MSMVNKPEIQKLRRENQENSYAKLMTANEESDSYELFTEVDEDDESVVSGDDARINRKDSNLYGPIQRPARNNLLKRGVSQVFRKTKLVQNVRRAAMQYSKRR